MSKRKFSSVSTSVVPSSSSSVAPSSSSHNWIHDVFLSFRGEDVRVGFLSHIQKEFKRKLITPFIDNEIKRGESIAPELIQAIRGSKIAIILLSKNYASSKWCLNELVEIMNCRKELGQTVMAIFYKVEPSDVKKLTGYFGAVFGKTCKDKSEKDIKRWKKALAEVATIAGYHSINWKTEADMIEEIATDVSNVLMNTAPSNDFNSLIGMRAHMEQIEPLLPLDSDEVKMIGIWGPSGIGKSTIARFLFSKHSHQFQLSVFMENIKTRIQRPFCNDYSAKQQLQNEFLSEIISQKDVKINHLGVVQDRLKDKRVLVVLDDVDHLLQLEAMAKETWWFGRGSWIIITTQDKRILNQHRINHIYEVGFPHDDEALQIFCMNAFGQSSPYEGFEDLAWEATHHCGKLPLGLRVMGSHFKGMDKLEWKKELPRLRNNLDGDIESTLKFSYDALFEEDKRLFLFIACFFNHQTIEKVEAFLETNFSDVRRGLHVLYEKSLISIKYNVIQMHDLLRHLGREIVSKQSIEKRQFLSDARDICQVLSNDTVANRSLIGINFEYSEIEDELYQSDIVFDRMHALEFLRIWSYSQELTSYIPEKINHLPRKLKLLCWHCCPMKTLPSNFNPEFLVELDVSYSKLEKLWEGIKMIRNLKWIILSYCKDLKELTELSTATNLKELDLSYCSSLVELPSSIGDAINLKKLNLEGCSSLVELPSSIGDAINLKKLNLKGCSSLVELPSSIGNAINVKKLDLEGCSSLVELPSSVGNVINLKELNLSGCSSLVELHSSIGNAINLKRLILKGCSKLQVLPININIKSLYELDLSDCSLLKQFPEISTNITVLKLHGTGVKEVPSPIKLWAQLKYLSMSYSENLEEFPHVFNFITELHLSDTRIQEIAPWIKRMSRLDKLVIKGCTKLVSLPELPKSITTIDAENCESLERLDYSFHSLEHFGCFNFGNCFKLNQEVRDLIMTSACKNAVLPGDKVPENFTYRAIGNSLSVTLNGIDREHPKYLRAKACFLLVNKGDVEVYDKKITHLPYCYVEKQNDINILRISRGYFLKHHLYTFNVGVTTSSREVVFKFKTDDEKWEIGECGIQLR